MPDVPNLPGVPPLSSYSVTDIVLDFVDGLLNLFLPPVWGIFYNGVPIILPASFIPAEISGALGDIGLIASAVGFPNVIPATASMSEFEYSADSPISNYPQEQGAFQSYNKVQLPFDVKVRLAASGAGNRQALFGTAEALRTSTILVDVVTPDRVYTSCNCKHVDYRRNASNGVDLVVVDMWFEQVRNITQTTFSNTMNPSDAGTQANGNVQPQEPGPAVTQAANGFAAGPH